MRETKLLREINKYQSGIYFEYNWIPDKLGRILGWGSHFEINIMSTSSFEEEIYISNYEFLSLIIGFYNSGSNEKMVVSSGSQILEQFKLLVEQYTRNGNMRSLYENNISKSVLNFVNSKLNIDINKIQKSSSYYLIEGRNKKISIKRMIISQQ